MRARITRRGGELMLTIPDEIASRANLAEDGEVDLHIDGSHVTISAPEEPTLADMLDRITPENRHDLVDFGDAVGKEVW